MIEDARARQRRHRRIGWALAATAVAAGALIAGITGGGSGGDHASGQPSNSGSGAGPGHVPANNAFPGAPSTQPNGYGVETGACPLAPPNRYLPARSGCVTVTRGDVDGDGRPDLILVYSHLSGRHPSDYAGARPLPPSLRHDFVAKAAFLKVVFANGASVSARLETRAAAVDALANVNEDPGREIFLEIWRISSGATGAAYSFANGRLVSAGAPLGYGGDSASKAGFNCLPGKPPRLIQHTFELVGPTIAGWWRETRVTYLWHGPRLVQNSKRTFMRRGAVIGNDTDIGRGCTAGIR